MKRKVSIFDIMYKQACQCSAIESITIAQRSRKIFQRDREIDQAKRTISNF